VRDPRVECGCMSDSDFKGLFPEWATEWQINESMLGEWPEPEPEGWPQCNPTPSCSFDYYFNELTCDCWPLYDYECHNDCAFGMEVRDPTIGCGCISESDFKGLFPEWATEWDIQESMLGQWRDPEPEPPIGPDLGLADYWPQCK